MFEISVFSLESVDLQASRVTGRVTTQTLLACFHELFGPRVEVVGLDAFTTTQLVDRDLTSETFKDYVDLLFCGVFPASGWPNLPSEPSSVFAPFFSSLVLVLSLLGQVCFFPSVPLSLKSYTFSDNIASVTSIHANLIVVQLSVNDPD